MADYKKYKVGITVKEPWANDISYEVLDMSLYAVENGGDGCSYVALKDNEGVTPGSDATVWLKATQAGQSIYDLAVKYGHFVGTEEEFEAQYQQVLQDARDAATATNATNAEVTAAEALRVTAEQGRVSAESGRVSAEATRVSNEEGRVSAESGRVSAESSRVSAEEGRVSAESGRVSAEEGRVSAEAGRVSAESGRVAEWGGMKTDVTTAIGQADAATARAIAAAENVEADHAQYVSDHSQASNDHTRAESDHSTASDDHTTAVSDHGTAGNDHTVATGDHSIATSDHSTASDDHTLAGTDHSTAVSDHGIAAEDHSTAASDHTTASTDHTNAAADHTLAGTDHTTASDDHGIAQTDHTTAAGDHTQAGTDHGIAQEDHTLAASDHTTAASDHTTAGTDHTTAQGDHTQAGEDHAQYLLDHASIAEKVSQSDLEDGTVVPRMAETLQAWADQKALAKEDVYSDKVRTSGGDIPIETSEGCKIRSIRPSADFAMKFFFNGSYNMLNAAKWGNTNSQALVGGTLTGGCYFLVPKLTLGSFGTADENNGLLFTLEDGTNISPTVYFKALGSSAPSSLTDGTVVTPTSVSYDGKTYDSYECSGSGWFILTYPSGKTMDDICAHIAWEDWYDKYVGLDEDPATNAEAALGILMVESFLALLHSDKTLRYIDEEHLDFVEFTETSAVGHHVVDLKVTVAGDWTNVQDGDNYTHTASVGSNMKSGGVAILLDGTELEVNGTQVSFTDQNASVSGDKLTIKYERASEEVITKAYTDTVFNGSNIENTTGKLSINDCSIEAQVGASGTAAIAVLYAINTVDKLGLIAQVDFQELLNTVDEQNLEINDLNRVLMEEMAKDPDAKYGQPRILWGNGTPAEATVPTNWKQFPDGGYNWIGKPAFVGQIYINTAVNSGGMYIGYKTSGSLLEWRTIVG